MVYTWRVPVNKKRRIIKDREERGCVVSPVVFAANEEIEISSRNMYTLRQREGSTKTLLLVKAKATGDR
ncbi:unnamed protein product [Lasius platythorax]|uniref:Uncharacterized protein n=1 Tax=Lasius platythorax TaxID=488582 RepID=A0AAV2MXM6_9HYME